NDTKVREQAIQFRKTINEQRTLERTCMNNDGVDNKQVSVQMEDQSYNQIRVLEEGGVKYLEIKLSDKHNHVMLCDIEDYKLVISRKWYAKSEVKSKYRCYRCVDGDSVAFHRLLYPQWAVISHINKNRLDNRRFNLCNGRIHVKTYSNNKSGYNGVCFDRSKQRWIVTWYKDCKSKVRYFPGTESDEESKNEAIQFRKSIDAQRIQNTMFEVDDLEEGEIYNSNNDTNKGFNDYGYIQEDEDEISNFMELEEDDVGIDHEDYIDPEEGLNIELVPVNTSEHVNNKEYDIEEMFDFEKFNDDQFNEQ
ncbi:6421_t:CDS:1, partial [Acaulospora colombiana]